MIKTLRDSCYQITGPVLFDYVCWILKEAQKKQINKIYFLARDGYLLYEIAKKICLAENLPIECKYLYCSRVSLRLPSYHLIGEEAYDLLLAGSYDLSRYSILKRIALTKPQREQLYEELGYDTETEKDFLNYEGFETFTSVLRHNATYRQFVEEKSKSAYPDTIAYFRQEGLFDQDTIAIADSGWSGSMQHSLKQLLESAGYNGTIAGFYFGMFRYYKPEPTDGELNSWYFSPTTDTLNKLLFCNNLFECFLSAPHGMTIGYEKHENTYIPILKPMPSPQMLEVINEQIQYCLEYADSRLSSSSLSDFDYRKAKRKSQTLLRRLMTRPSREEALIYSNFLFCDDIAEATLTPLTGHNEYYLLKDNYSVTKRIIRKLNGTSRQHINKELFWPYGTAALTGNCLEKWWNWLNIFWWEWIKYQITK